MLNFAMQRKVNLEDMESYLVGKANAQEMHQMIAAVESKAD